MLTNTFIFFIGLSIILFISVLVISKDLPSLEQLQKFDPETISKIYSADGVLLKQLYTHKRDVVLISKVPKYLRESLLVMEDRDFYNHSGFSIKGIFRAIIIDVMTLSTRQGASTITQQLARNIYNIIGFEKTIIRKIKEILTAIQIEKTYTKSEIMEMYLNSVYFGHGTYGVQAASKFYYGKDVSELYIDEAALLIAMLPAPARYSPLKYPERAIFRRNLVLKQLKTNGYIDAETFDIATKKELLNKKDVKKENYANYFTEYVRRELEKIDEDLNVDLYQDGLMIFTTLDTRIQNEFNKNFEKFLKKNQKILFNDIKNNEEKFNKILEINKIESDSLYKIIDSLDVIPKEHRNELLVQGSGIIMDSNNGYVLGLIGGRQEANYVDHFNRATQAKRQPGSVFKPFIYMTAFENGYKPTTELLNQPLVVFIDDTTQWNPQNHDGSTGLLTTLRDGLKRSLNLISVRIVQELIKPIDVKRNAKAFGLSTPIRAFDAIALGTSEVIPIEMVSAYSTIANNGIYKKPIVITKIKNRFGKTIWEYTPTHKEIKNESIIYLVRDLMKSVIDKGTGSSIRWKYKFNSPAAGKTGTTDSKTDAWFVGFTPQITMGVWVGMDNPAISLGKKQYGSSAALPVWATTMKDIYKIGEFHTANNNIVELEKSLDWSQPSGIAKIDICSDTYNQPTDWCPIKNEIYLKEYKPLKKCSKHSNPFSRFGN